MIVLGIHGGVMPTQHDAGAALVIDGKIIAVCEEERYVRYKGAFGHLPIRAIHACLNGAGIAITDVNQVVSSGSTHGDLQARIRRYFAQYFGHVPSIVMIEHQMAHLASAYYASGFERAMVVSLDAYGDQASGALAVGQNGRIEIVERLAQDQSLGLFYAAITSHLGFAVSEDEYKVMGLAAYGHPGIDLTSVLQPVDQGRYRADPRYWTDDLRPVSRFERYFTCELEALLGPARLPGEPITQRHSDIAYAAQSILERSVVELIKDFHARTGIRKLAMAGGVALNCLCNWRVQQLPEIDDLFVQPAASDRGIALGAALYGAAIAGDRTVGLTHVQYGSAYNEAEIEGAVRTAGYPYTRCLRLADEAADSLQAGRIIGWFQGRSEFGPRALGGRSILADPRDASMKDRINQAVKYREPFRPFAPSVRVEDFATIFACEIPSPFMTITYPVRTEWCERIPAVTHADGTARVQTVSAQVTPLFHQVLTAFAVRTGVPVLMNTSFNVAGEPMVETPLDALATFARSGLDELFIGPFRVVKPGRRSE